MRIARLFLLAGVIFLVTGNSRAQERQIRWDTSPVEPLWEAVRILENTVAFPSTGTNLPIEADERAVASANGQFALIYNWKTKTARVYDASGQAQSQFETDQSYGYQAISNAGLIVMYWDQHPEIKDAYGGTTDVRVYDDKGNTLYQLDDQFLIPGPLQDQFSPDGKLVALLGVLDGYGRKVPSQRAAVLVNESGELLTRRFPEPMTTVGIRFGSDKILFIAYHFASLPSKVTELHVFDAASNEWFKVVADGIIAQNDVVAFSENEKSVYTAFYNVIRRYDIKTGAVEWEWEANRPDGRETVSVSSLVRNGDVISATFALPTGTGERRYDLLVTALGADGRVLQQRIVAADATSIELDKASRVRWAMELPAPPSRIRVEDEKVIFPGQEAKPVLLGDFESAYVSDNGQLVVIYSRKTLQAVVYDALREKKSEFKTDKQFGVLLISNTGLIAAYGEITFGVSPAKIFRLYDLNGKLLHRIDNRFYVHLVVRFSPGGEIVAVFGIIATTPQDNEMRILLFDKETQLLSKSISEVSNNSGIEFGPIHSIVFLTYEGILVNEERKLVNRAWIYDATLATWKTITFDDINRGLNANAITFSNDEKTLFVADGSRVQAYDVASGKIRWQREISAPETEKAPVAVLDILWASDYIVSAHAITDNDENPWTYKILLTFLDSDGKTAKTALTDVYSFRGRPTQLLRVSQNGRSIELDLNRAPSIELPSAVKLP